MNFIKTLKVPLYFTSIAPVLLAWALNNFKNFPIFTLLSFTVFFFQIAINLSMDIDDYKNGQVVRFENTYFPLGPYSIKIGNLSVKMVKFLAFLTFSLSAIFAIVILLMTQRYILIMVGALALIFSIFYLIKPFQFHKKGIGEISTFFNFGPIPLIGALIAFGKTVSIVAIILSIFLGLSTSAIRYIHHFPEENKNSIRFKKFKLIYSLIVLTAFIIPIYVLHYFFILFIFFAITHIYFLPNSTEKIAIKTRELVIIQILAIIAICLYLW